MDGYSREETSESSSFFSQTSFKAKPKVSFSDSKSAEQKSDAAPIPIRSHRHPFVSSSVRTHGRTHPINPPSIFNNDFSPSASSSFSSSSSSSALMTSDSFSSSYSFSSSASFFSQKKKFLPNVNISRQSSSIHTPSSGACTPTPGGALSRKEEVNDRTKTERTNNEDNMQIDLGNMLSHSLSLKSSMSDGAKEKELYDRKNNSLAKNIMNKNAGGRASGGGMNDNRMLFSSVLEANKKCIKIDGTKKSKNLLELSWADETSSSVYTPISLPYILKETSNNEQQNNGKEAEESQKKQQKTKRPSVKHVDESNRNAASLFLPFKQNDNIFDGENNFFHIQFPAVFPALDRAAMERHFCKKKKKKKKEKKRNYKNEEEKVKANEQASEHSASSVDVTSSSSSEKEEEEETEEGKGQEKENSAKEGQARKANKASSSYSSAESVYMGSRLEELPCGRLGKLMIFKSGKVKLKIGEILFDVNHGSECNFAQEVGCIIEDNSEFLLLGRCNKRMVVTPDIEYLMSKNTEDPLL